MQNPSVTVELVDYLCSHGADINNLDGKEHSTLISKKLAKSILDENSECKFEHIIPIVKYFIKHGYHYLDKVEHKITPLYIAIAYNSVELLRILISKDIDINQQITTTSKDCYNSDSDYDYDEHQFTNLDINSLMDKLEEEDETEFSTPITFAIRKQSFDAANFLIDNNCKIGELEFTDIIKNCSNKEMISKILDKYKLPTYKTDEQSIKNFCAIAKEPQMFLEVLQAKKIISITEEQKQRILKNLPSQ